MLLPLIPFAMPGGVIDSIGAGAGGGGGGIGPGGKNGKQVSMFALLSGQLNRDKAADMVKVTNVSNDPNPYYLRFNVLEELTSRGFNAKPITGGKPVGSGLPAPGWDPRSRPPPRRPASRSPTNWPSTSCRSTPGRRSSRRSTTTGPSTPPPPSCSPASRPPRRRSTRSNTPGPRSPPTTCARPPPSRRTTRRCAA
ncbi:hypothetical protein [Dactylosporangium cerinum]